MNKLRVWKSRIHWRMARSRVAAAWHVLHGRPVVYRYGRLETRTDVTGVRFFDTTLFLDADNLSVTCCSFQGFGMGQGEPA